MVFALFQFLAISKVYCKEKSTFFDTHRLFTLFFHLLRFAACKAYMIVVYFYVLLENN